MNNTNSPETETAEGGMTITRVFDAPRDLVFKAWTDPERFQRWWGPKDYTAPTVKIDARPGGLLHYCMRSPEGEDHWGRGVYSEVVENERLVYMDSFADENGNAVPAEHYGMSPDWPAETLVTVTFEDQDGKTKLTLRHAIPGEDADAQQGWSESLDKLAKLVEQK